MMRSALGQNSSSAGAAVGRPAPDFELPDHAGRILRLRDLLNKPVIVFFFPKAFTPGCTAQACAFRAGPHPDDSEPQPPESAVLKSLSIRAHVLGVSTDSISTLAAFARRFEIDYPLLSDADGALHRAWRVPRTLGLFRSRTTYTLDALGVVRDVFSSQLRPGAHAQRALHAIDAIERAAAWREPH